MDPEEEEEEMNHIVVEMSDETAVQDVDGDGDGDVDGDGEISPLLSTTHPQPQPPNRPKINIFSLSYSRRNLREQVKKVVETEAPLHYLFISWIWSGSKYSGFLCMALSTSIYFLMHIISDTFSVQPVPLFESVFARCTIILISSFVWLRRSGQPIFGPPHLRSILASRALMGCLSLFSFIYSVQSLPLSQAIVLNFTTPIMSSIAARFLLQEKLKLADVGGLACSFFGLLFIFRPMLNTQGLTETGEASIAFVGRINHPIYAVCAGLFSSIIGGISCCLIRSGARASDQPMVTVFSFGILACPLAAIWSYSFQDLLLPNLYSFLLMILLGVLSFFAEVFLARGLQLEKTSRVTNIQYIEVVLLQMWNISLSRAPLSFGRLAGCLLILVSITCTMYFGHEKEVA